MSTAWHIITLLKSYTPQIRIVILVSSGNFTMYATKTST